MSDVIIRLRDCSFRYRQADADSEDGASPRGAAAGERRQAARSVCWWRWIRCPNGLRWRAAACDDGMLLRADSTLRKRMWYPTMCAAEDTLRDQCDIVRTLHKLPPLDREA